MKFSPDGRFLFTASEDKSIKIIDFATKNLIHHFKDIHEGIEIDYFSLIFSESITCISVSPDGKQLISGSADESIKILDIPGRQEIYCFKEAHKGLSHH